MQDSLMYERFKKEMARLLPSLNEKTALLIAFSGGADSLCLLDLMLRLREEGPGFYLCAQHQQHMIRGEDAFDDALFCRDFCRMHAVDFFEDRDDIPALAKASAMSLEACGRMKRRENWKKHCSRLRQQGYQPYLVTAHHADDQAETLLLRLERGSGLQGLGAIRAERDCYLRPLLIFSRAEIEAYLKERGLTWRSDKSNEDTRFRRNFLRHELLPLWQEKADPGLTLRLAGAASLLQESFSINSAYIRRTRQTLRRWPEQPFYDPLLSYYSVKAFRTLSGAVQKAVLHDITENVLGLKDYSEAQIDAMCRIIREDKGERHISLPGGTEFISDGFCFYFKKQSYLLKPPLPLSPEENFSVLLSDLVPGPCGTGQKSLCIADLHIVLLPAEAKRDEALLLYNELSELVLRTRRSGDYILNGRKRRLLLKDYFSEQKVPKALREKILLLCRDSQVLLPPLTNGARLNRYESVKIRQCGLNKTECFRLIWYNSRNK